MQITEVSNEEMYCLFAPDGTWQAMTLGPDFPSVVAQIKMLHKAKMVLSFHDLMMKGYKILPVKVSMVQNGDEDKPFNNKTK